MDNIKKLLENINELEFKISSYNMLLKSHKKKLIEEKLLKIFNEKLLKNTYWNLSSIDCGRISITSYITRNDYDKSSDSLVNVVGLLGLTRDNNSTIVLDYIDEDGFDVDLISCSRNSDEVKLKFSSIDKLKDFVDKFEIILMNKDVKNIKRRLVSDMKIIDKILSFAKKYD